MRIFNSNGTGNSRWDLLDMLFTGAVTCQVVLGCLFLFISSTSIGERLFGNPLFLLQRHMVFLGLSLVFCFGLLRSRVLERPLGAWRQCGFIASGLQALPLMPFVGIEIHGAHRWVGFGPIVANLTPLSMVLMVIYFAGLLSRHRLGHPSRTRAVLLDVAPIVLFTLFSFVQPDNGALVILFVTLLIMLLHSGRYGLVCGLLFTGVTSCCLYFLGSPYSWLRLTQFIDPFSDPFDRGYQLSLALTAIGGGDWAGIGLNGSVLKPYLPGAYDAFVFAIPVEELGVGAILLAAALSMIQLGYMVSVALKLRALQLHRESLIVAGFACWLNAQSILHLMIELGYAPTLSVAYPFISYSNTTTLAALTALALTWRLRQSSTLLTNNQVNERSSERITLPWLFSILYLAVGGLAVEKAICNEQLDREYLGRVAALKADSPSSPTHEYRLRELEGVTTGSSGVDTPEQ